MTTQSIVLIEGVYRAREFRGLVILTVDDSHLPGVEIRFMASERPDLVHRVFTDGQGRFTAPRVAPGVYAFRTCAAGYTSLGGIAEIADSAESAELRLLVGLAF